MSNQKFHERTDQWMSIENWHRMTWNTRKVFIFSCEGHLEINIERNFILKCIPK
jgi:hypothetical protein